MLYRLLPCTMVNVSQYRAAFLWFYFRAFLPRNWFGKQFTVIAAKP